MRTNRFNYVSIIGHLNQFRSTGLVNYLCWAHHFLLWIVTELLISSVSSNVLSKFDLKSCQFFVKIWYRFSHQLNIIDRWRSKTSENPIYEKWQQCQSHDPAIWLLAGDVCWSLCVCFQQQWKHQIISSINIVGNSNN